MTSKLKCPVCKTGEIKSFKGGEYCCKNPDCEFYMEKESDAYNALIQSQKDLEIALTAIKEIAEECGCLMAALKSTGFESVVETFDKNIRKKLNQIEHKDSK